MIYRLDKINLLICQFENEQKDLLFINNYDENKLPRKYWVNQGALTILKDLENQLKLQEKKIPEKIKLYPPYPECEDIRFEDIEYKINEIIDYLKIERGE